MTKDEIVSCIQALSRIEGATIDTDVAGFIAGQIEYINEMLLKLLKEKECLEN